MHRMKNKSFLPVNESLTLSIDLAVEKSKIANEYFCAMGLKLPWKNESEDHSVHLKS